MFTKQGILYYIGYEYEHGILINARVQNQSTGEFIADNVNAVIGRNEFGTLKSAISTLADDYDITFRTSNIKGENAIFPQPKVDETYASQIETKKKAEEDEQKKNGTYIYDRVEQMPVYEYGNDRLAESFTYYYTEPNDEKTTKGVVDVSFVVDKDGSVSDAEILKGLSPKKDAEALRVIKLLKFILGKQKGAPVKVRLTKNFKL